MFFMWIDGVLSCYRIFNDKYNRQTLNIYSDINIYFINF